MVMTNPKMVKKVQRKLHLLQNLAHQIHDRLSPHPDLLFLQLHLQCPEQIFRRTRVTGILKPHLENASRKVQRSLPVGAAIPGPPIGFPLMMRCSQYRVVGMRMTGINPT
jgi:hypothetical protein